MQIAANCMESACGTAVFLGFTVFSLMIKLMCLFATSSSAASVHRWLNQRCQVSCSLPEHYTTSVSLHAGTVLNLKQFPA
jgi:hypothetical protein